jgi:hypothetical protein
VALPYTSGQCDTQSPSDQIAAAVSADVAGLDEKTAFEMGEVRIIDMVGNRFAARLGCSVIIVVDKR